MKHLRRTAALGAAALLVGITACGDDASGGGDSSSNGEDLAGTLSFANWQFLEPNRGDEIYDVVSSYTDENPDAEIEPIEISRDNYERTLSTEMGAGGGPDLLIVPDAFFPELTEAGLLEPLDDVIEESGATELRDMHEEFNSDGQQLAVLWEVVSYALFWNQEIFDEAGVEPPTNIEELISVAETIEDEAGVTGFTVRHQMNEEAPWWTDHSNWEFGFGGSWSDGSSLTIDSPENIEAVEAYKEVYDSAGFGRGQDASTYRSAFSEGELGMAIDNSSAVLTLIGDAVPSENIGAAPLPFPTDGSAYVGTTIAVNANSENKELAKDFIRWMLTDEIQQDFSETLFPSSVATESTPSPELIDEHPWTEPFFDQAENASGVIIPGFETQTPEIRTIILTEIERVLTEDVSAEDALGQAQEQAEALG